MIPIAKPIIGKEEKEAVLKVLDSGILTQGPVAAQFERNFAEFIGSKHAIVTDSGTAALHTALLANNIKEKDEVITSPFTFIASSNSILQVGAKPVFVDVEEDTFNINPDLIQEKISKKTKAILPIHLFGHPADLKEILKIAKDNNLIVIEDGCQAHNASIDNKKIGSFSTTCFSFHPTKNMTSVDFNEPVILKDSDNKTLIRPIGEFVEEQIGKNNIGDYIIKKCRGWKCAAFDLSTLKINFLPISKIIKHKCDKRLYKITLKTGREVKVTENHSIFVIEEGKIKTKTVKDLKEGDFLVVPKNIPNNNNIKKLNLVEEFLKLPEDKTKDLWVTGIIGSFRKRGRNGNSVPLLELKQKQYKLKQNSFIHSKSFKLRSEIKVSKELCRLLGYYVAEGGCTGYDIQLIFGHHEKKFVEDVKDCVKVVFNLPVRIYKRKSSYVVCFGARYLKHLFKHILEIGENVYKKRVPNIIFNTTVKNQLEFLKGYFRDGNTNISKRSSYLLRYTSVSNHIVETLPYLLLLLSVNPTIHTEKRKTRDFGTYISKTKNAFRISIGGKNQLKKFLSIIPKKDKSKFIDHINKPSFRALDINLIPTNHAAISSLVKEAKIKTSIKGRTEKVYNNLYQKMISNLTLKKVIEHTEKTGKNITKETKEELNFLRLLTTADIGFLEIKKIKIVKPTRNYVYDLSVKGCENFIGGIGGVCLHNTGKGGMITTNNDEIAEKSKLIRLVGEREKYYFDILGFNYRISDINAAVGIEQLKKLEDFTKQRIKNASFLNKNIKTKGIILPKTKPNCRHVFHQYTIRITDKCKKNRDEVQEFLRKNEISSSIHYPIPVYKQKLYKDLGYKDNLKVTEKLTKEVLSIPVHPSLSQEDLNKIVNTLNSI